MSSASENGSSIARTEAAVKGIVEALTAPESAAGIEFLRNLRAKNPDFGLFTLNQLIGLDSLIKERTNNGTQVAQQIQTSESIHPEETILKSE